MRRERVTLEMLHLMSPEDQARYSSDGYLLAGAKEPELTNKPPNNRLEREEHKVFMRWLDLHGYPYSHARTDKRTTDQLGLPDFCVYDKFRMNPERTKIAKAILIEMKLPGNKLSLVQELWASVCGAHVHILSSALEAIELIKKEFGE